MVQEAARFTRFSVELKSGETIRTLEHFKTDIGIQLEANGEILIDHIKGTKYLSVDVPFAGASKAISLLKHLNLLDGSSGALDFVAGQKADGRFEVVDIAKAPHMLIAGTTGSGKTIFLYSIIVEVKSVLSTEKCALFPTVFSERALKQLEKLRDLLSLGYRVHYSVISLNPHVSSIYFVSDAQFTPLLKSCIDLGMTISAFSCRIDDNRVYIDKRLQILLP